MYQFFPELASYYVGSVLMQIKIDEDTSPERKAEKLSLKAPSAKHVYYKLTALITAGINLHNKKKKYSVAVRFGNE